SGPATSMTTKTMTSSAPVLTGVSWEELADGRLWRLKRGKHFTIEPRALQEQAGDVATRLGKAVKSIRDVIGTHEYVWLQFADHSVPLGDPCPCGGVELERLHQDFARCTNCGSTLLITASRTGESATDPFEGLSRMRRLVAQSK